MAQIFGVDSDTLDRYILNDQPTTCGLCGARTDFEKITNVMQLHKCLNPDCGYKFIAEEDESSFES